MISRYLLENASSLIQNKTILELGAGGGLPSLICAAHGARQVVVTDYPDAELIENLNYNITTCTQLSNPKNIIADGYLWGAPVAEIAKSISGSAKEARFDILILADLLFNHSEHQKLVKTVRLTLARTPKAKALVFFTPYRPWLLEKDLSFFDLVKNNDFGELDADIRNNDKDELSTSGRLAVNKILEEVMDDVMFKEDRGDELLRRTVFGYEIVWADLQE